MPETPERDRRWEIRYAKKKPTDHFAEWQVEGPITSGVEVIPASSLERFAERVAGELDARAEEYDRKGQDRTHFNDALCWGFKQQAHAYREAAALIRDHTSEKGETNGER